MSVLKVALLGILAFIYSAGTALAKVEKPVNLQASQKVNYRTGHPQVKLSWETNPLSDPFDQVWIHKAYPKHKPAIKAEWIKIEATPTEYGDEDKIELAKSYKYTVYYVRKIVNQKGVAHYAKVGAKPVQITLSATWQPAIEHQGIYAKSTDNIPLGTSIYKSSINIVLQSIDDSLVDYPDIRSDQLGAYIYHGQLELVFYEEDAYGIRKIDLGPDSSHNSLYSGISWIDTSLIQYLTRSTGGLIDCRGGQMAVDSETIAAGDASGNLTITSQSIEQGIANAAPPGSGYLAVLFSEIENGRPVQAMNVILTTGYNKMTVIDPIQGGILRANQQSDPDKIVTGRPFNCGDLADQSNLQLVGARSFYQQDIEVDEASTVKFSFDKCVPSVSGTFASDCDGVVTDSSTGLMWEQKTSAYQTPHYVLDSFYTWSATFGDTLPDGYAYSTFLAKLNCTGDYTSNCVPFAGHNDWRLPTIDELFGIVDPTAPGLAINPIFGLNSQSVYWSASTDPGDPTQASAVDFHSGGSVYQVRKDTSAAVRAVRGGS